MSDAHAMLAGLCPAGGHFALTARLAGRRYQVSRLRWLPKGDGAAIVIEGAIDQAALELGASVLADRIELELDSAARPKHYLRISGGQRLEIGFEAGQAHAELKDGTRFDVTAEPEALLDGNAPALSAIVLRRLFYFAGSVAQRCPAFLAGQLLPLSYSVTPDGEGRWRSSLEETLVVDGEGALVELAMAKQALAVRRAEAEDLALLEMPAAPPETAPPRPASAGEEFDVALPAGTVRALLRGGDPRARGTVLLLSGSGRVDRFGRAGGVDTGIGAIADAVADQGFAALTGDQPGSGESRLQADALETGFGGELLWAEALLDAAVRRSVSPIALIGHSLGGLLALELAVRRPADVAAIALLATPGRPLDQVMEDQIRWIGERRGVTADVIAKQVAEHRRLVELVRTVPEWNAETVPERFLAQIRARDWLAEVIDIDPVELAGRVSCPIFVAQGDRDVQVGAESDFARLAVAGANIEARLYPGLNHLFRPAAEGEGVAAYSRSDAPVAPELLEDLLDFLARNLR